MVASKFEGFFKKKFNKKNNNPYNLNIQKVFKKTGRCFNYGKQCHLVKACKALKKEDKEEAHNVNHIDNFFIMLF